jgi:hypothetical protein
MTTPPGPPPGGEQPPQQPVPPQQPPPQQPVPPQQPPPQQPPPQYVQQPPPQQQYVQQPPPQQQYAPQPAPVYYAAQPVAPPVAAGKLGGQKLIALAVVGVLAVGGTGLLLSKALANDDGAEVVNGGGGPGGGGGGGGPIGETTTTQFGGGGTTATTQFGGGGTTAPPQTTAAPQTTLAPQTTQPPATTTTQPQGGGGPSVSLANGVVNVPVPSGWNADAGADYIVLGKAGFFVYIDVLKLDGPVDAASAAGGIVDNWIVNGEGYSQVQRADVTALDAFGTVQSFAFVGYAGMWTDQNGSFPACGSIWVAARQDNWLLRAQLEGFGQNGIEEACNNYGNEFQNGTLGQIIAGAAADFGSR